MKKHLLFLASITLMVLGFPHACCAQILDSKGGVLPEVVAIFRHYKPLIEKNKSEICQKTGLSSYQIDQILDANTPLSDVSLAHLNDIAQTVFLRPPLMERKDALYLKDKFLPYTSEVVLKLFRTIGDVGNIYPKRSHYQYILLNGSTVQNMRYRIQTLIYLVQSKKLLVTPKTEIIFLTGDRDLYPEEDLKQLKEPHPLKQDPSWQQPPQSPQTEGQAAEWIWGQTLLPEALRKAKITFVQAKKKEMVDPKTGKTLTKRPTTFDTIQTWIEEKDPEPGSCLSVSSQPFVHYQQTTIYGYLKKIGLIEKGFTVDGAGMQDFEENLSSGCSFKGTKEILKGKERDQEADLLNLFRQMIPLVLDNFARTIYVELQIQKEQ